MTGALTTWRANSGADAIIQNDQGNNGLNIEDGANGIATLRSDGTGRVRLLSSDDTDGFFASTVVGEQAFIQTNSASALVFQDTETSFRNMSARPVTMLNGASSDERHRFNSTSIIRGVTASGLVDSVFEAMRIPITNGQTIAAGDYVVVDAAGAMTCRAAPAASTAPPVGTCLVGGTGDAGNTIAATIAMGGVETVFTADDAGVTNEQYVIPGGTTANEAASQTTIEGSFAIAYATAPSGVNFPGMLIGPH